MAIYVDDKPVTLDGADLESLLHAATDHLSQSGRIIVEIQLDGQSLVDDLLTQHQHKPVDDAELRLYTADPHELATLTLGQVRQQLQDAKLAQTQAAELFQKDIQDEAMKQIERAIGIWMQTQQAVLTCVQLIGIDFDNQEVDGRSIKQITDELVTLLTSLRDMLTAGDTVALADTLAYEWPPCVDQWDRLVTELISWVEQDRAQHPPTDKPQP